MREDDVTSNDSTRLELGHVYSKLESLEQGQKENTKGLHEVQLELARGRRFPLPMYGFLGSLTLAVLGATFVLYSELKLNTAAVAEMPELRERLTSAFSGMRAAEQAKSAVLEEQVRMRNVLGDVDRRCCQEMPVIGEKVKNLEGRIVGNTAEGWHRRDHELYAESVRLRFENLEKRMDAQEQRSQVRDSWWDALKSKGVLK